MQVMYPSKRKLLPFRQNQINMYDHAQTKQQQQQQPAAWPRQFLVLYTVLAFLRTTIRCCSWLSFARRPPSGYTTNVHNVAQAPFRATWATRTVQACLISRSPPPPMSACPCAARQVCMCDSTAQYLYMLDVRNLFFAYDLD